MNFTVPVLHDLRKCNSSSGDIRVDSGDEIDACKDECEDEPTCVGMVLNAFGATLKTSLAGKEKKEGGGYVLWYIPERVAAIAAAPEKKPCDTTTLFTLKVKYFPPCYSPFSPTIHAPSYKEN